MGLCQSSSSVFLLSIDLVHAELRVFLYGPRYSFGSVMAEIEIKQREIQIEGLSHIYKQRLK